MASDRLVSGAYKTEYGESDDVARVMARIEVSYNYFYEISFEIYLAMFIININTREFTLLQFII